MNILEMIQAEVSRMENEGRTTAEIAAFVSRELAISNRETMAQFNLQKVMDGVKA